MSSKYSEKYSTVLEHIDKYWDRLICHHTVDAETNIGLPRRFVVSNTDMFKEMYYWDSFFIATGLRSTPRRGLVIEITENLIYLLKRFGRIPNASRFYMLSRSQPPFLSSLVLMAYEILIEKDPSERTSSWLRYAYDAVEQEYRGVWRGTSFPNDREVRENLSRYYDLNIWHNAAEAESGWDMTPRFDNRCLDFVAVDLNSLLYKYEIDLSRMSDILKLDTVEYWKREAQSRISNVNSLLWNEKQELYVDYDLRNNKQSNFISVASFFPLYSKLASKDKADQFINRWLPKFETEYGVVTSEKWDQDPGDYSKQWAWPNGWAPLTWIVVQSLLNYGYILDARRIADKWLSLVSELFMESGELYEKYDVVHGRRAVSDRYPDQVGFGWTNAVFIDFVRFLDS